MASGSAGNSVLVCCGETRILIDAGLSARRLSERLAACGVTWDQLDGVAITHEHGDHTAALRVLSARAPVPIYANRMTAAVLQSGAMRDVKDWRLFADGAPFSIGSITLEAFSVPHDAVDPVGFLVRNSTATFAVLTDLGYVTGAVLERAREADAILVETNYDDGLLQQDEKRPWSVKQRIASRHGHLSNSDAAALLGKVRGGGVLRRAVLGHLSRDCNTPDLALASVQQVLAADDAGCGIEIGCAVQDVVGPSFAV